MNVVLKKYSILLSCTQTETFFLDPYCNQNITLNLERQYTRLQTRTKLSLSDCSSKRHKSKLSSFLSCYALKCCLQPEDSAGTIYFC